MEYRGGNLLPQEVDWQRTLIVVLWRLLPAEQKSITLTQEDQRSLMAAFSPEDPTLVVSSDGSNMCLTLTTMSAAIAQARAMGIDVQVPAGTAPLQ